MRGETIQMEITLLDASWIRQISCMLLADKPLLCSIKIIGYLRYSSTSLSVWRRMGIDCTARGRISISIATQLFQISHGPLN